MNKYPNQMTDKAYEYSKKFDLNITEGTMGWNDEADAFRHAYMQASLTLNSNKEIANVIGASNEALGDIAHKQDPKEKNMDLWNNAVGREIGNEVKKEIKGIEKSFTKEQIEDMIAVKINERIKNGDLITDPSADKRSYEKKKQGSATGYAADVNSQKTFTREEIAKMSPEEFAKNEKEIMRQMANGEIQNSKPDYKNYQNSNSGNGKIYTREEIAKMSSEEFQKHEKEIEKQMQEVGIPTESEIKDIQPKDTSWQKKPDVVKTNKANDDNVVGYVWVASPNSCEACQELDGKTFETEDDIPSIPHPNCGCTVERLIDDENRKNDDDDDDDDDDNDDDDYNNKPSNRTNRKYNRQNPMRFDF